MAGYGGRLDLQNMEVLWKYRVKDELENRGQVPGDYIVHWGGILAYPSGERLCGGQFAETLSTQNLNRLRPQLVDYHDHYFRWRRQSQRIYAS